MALGHQDRTGQSQALLTPGKLGAGGPRTSRSEVGQSEPRWGPPLRCCILLSHLLKNPTTLAPQTPLLPACSSNSWGGGPVQNFLETSPSRPKPQGLTGPSPNKTTASPAFRWLSPPPSRGHGLSPHPGPLGLPQPLAERTPSPPGKLLPLSQRAPSPPGASEALPLGPALLSHPSPPSPAASLPWGVEGSRDLWNFQGRRGWRPPPAQRQKSRAQGRPICACDLRAQG